MNNSLKLLVVSAAAALVAACGGGGDDAADVINTGSPEIRYVNVEEGTGTTELFDNISLIPNTSGGFQFASLYAEIKDDQHDYVIKEAGVETNRYTLDPDRGNKYTLVRLGNGDSNIIPIRDPYNNFVGTSQTRIRVVNAAALTDNPLGGTDAYDVYILPPNTDVQTAQPFIPNVAFRGIEPASGSESKLISAGTYELTIATPLPQNPPPGAQKFTPYSADITIPTDGDWLIVIVQDQGSLIPNMVHALIVPDNGAAFTPTDKLP